MAFGAISESNSKSSYFVLIWYIKNKENVISPQSHNYRNLANIISADKFRLSLFKSVS